MIIRRYIIRELIHTMLALIGMLLIIVLLNMLVQVLSKASDGSVPGALIFNLIGVAMPYQLTVLLPICFFLGIVICYGYLFANNELHVLFAGGFSYLDLLKITLIPAHVLFVIVSFLAFYAMPHMALYKKSILQNDSSKALMSMIHPKQLVSLHDGAQIVYVDQFDQDSKTFRHVFSYQKATSDDPATIITAESGKIINQDDHQYLVLYNGQTITDKNSPNMQQTSFKTYKVRMMGVPLLSTSSNMDAVPTLQLLADYTPANATQFQWRATFPLTIFNMMLIGLCICRVSSKQGRFAHILHAILIFIIYYNCIIGVNSLMEHQLGVTKINLWQLHGLVFVFGLVWLWYLDGCYWFKKNKRLKNVDS